MRRLLELSGCGATVEFGGRFGGYVRASCDVDDRKPPQAAVTVHGATGDTHQVLESPEG